MMELELVRIKCSLPSYYWRLDSRGVYLESDIINSKKEAVIQLVSGQIKWTTISIDDRVEVKIDTTAKL